MSSCKSNNVEYAIGLGLLAVDENPYNEIVNPIRTIKMSFYTGR